jgi:hypothetical protein
MEEFKKQIKASLDEYVFKNIISTEENNVNFINDIKKQSPLRQYKNKFRFMPQILAIITILLISSILLKPYFFNTTKLSATPTASMEKEANEIFDKNINIPEFKEYPISFAAITMSPFKDQPSDLTVSYSSQKGDMDPKFKKANERKQWEINQKAKLLYGPYSGKKLFDIQYRPGKIDVGSVENLENKMINGIPLQYQYSKKQSGEFIVVFMNYNGAAYNLNFVVDKEFTKADADNVLKEFIEQLKQN